MPKQRKRRTLNPEENKPAKAPKASKASKASKATASQSVQSPAAADVPAKQTDNQPAARHIPGSRGSTPSETSRRDGGTTVLVETTNKIMKRRREILFGPPPEPTTREKEVADMFLESIPYEVTMSSYAIDNYWCQLGASVASFASGLVWKTLEWEKLDTNVREKLSSFTPKADRFFRGGSIVARLLFQAWTWHLLIEHVFSEGGSKRRSKHWEAFALLRDFCKSKCHAGSSSQLHR